MLSKIKDYFFKGGNYFYSNFEALNFMNTNNDDFELYKAHNAKELNEKVSALNLNNDLVSSIRLAYEKGVIGTSINIQSRTDNQDFNSQFEYYIKQWSKRGNCEITGRFYRGLMERSLIGYSKIQGGFIIRHHYNKKWDIPYKLEIIPLSMIDTAEDNIYENKINGLKINNFGELKGIYIYTNSMRETSQLISAKDLTLFVIPFADPTQYSGVSPLAPIVATLDMLSAYNVAELRTAKQKAKGAIVVKTNLFNTILDIKKEKAKSSGLGNRVSEEELYNLYKAFKINGSLDGANYIPSDDDVINLQAKADSIFDSLDGSSKRTISAGAGLSTQSTFREMPSSYNAALLNAQLDEKQYAIDFTDFVEMVWRDVIEVRLLDALILSNKITLKDYWADPSKYREVEFIRESTSHIDPAKVEKAYTEGLESGVLNEIDIISSKGKDYKEHLKKKMTYKKIKKQLKKQLKKEMKNGL